MLVLAKGTDLKNVSINGERRCDRFAITDEKDSFSPLALASAYAQGTTEPVSPDFISDIPRHYTSRGFEQIGVDNKKSADRSRRPRRSNQALAPWCSLPATPGRSTHGHWYRCGA